MISRRFFLAAVALMATTSLTVARTAQPTATDCDGFLRNIRMSEGGGNYGTNTGNGYWGAYQFSEDALTDIGYMNDGQWTGKNGVNSLEDYLNNPTAQDDAFLSYGEKNLRYLGNWQQYIGQTIGGVKVTRAGLIAGSHLVGAGGMEYWLTSGGDCTDKGKGSDAVDGNGTCAGTYVAENQVDEKCSPGSSGSGSCLAAHPVISPVVFSEYGSWNRAGVDKGNNGWHRGVDIYPKAAQGQASKGQALFAAHDGKLTVGAMGLKVENGQFRTLYLHSGSIPESKDVKAGEEIGKIGDKRAEGKPHLHFEVQVPKSAVTATKCIIGQDTNDCAFPVVPGEKPKRDPNGYATSQSLASASPKAWFYVNPERYLKERVPVQGSATARTGRTESLPNSCTPGTSVAETPTSAGESDNTAALAGGFGDYLSGHGSGVANADKELRSVVIDMTRQSALDVRAATSSAAQMQAQFDAATAGLLSLYGRAGE